MNKPSVIDYLVIGHVAHDVLKEGPRAGGTALYSAIMARNLGLRVGVVTSTVDSKLLRDLTGILIRNVLTENATTFIHKYAGSSRFSKVIKVATKLKVESIPDTWMRTPIVHLGPVAHELDTSLAKIFHRNTLLGITPQGWFRVINRSQIVRYRPWKKATEVLGKARVVIISPEDVGGNERNIQKITLDVPYTVVTLAEKGSRLHQKNIEGEHFPTRPAKVVDPTGAGDVFAASFLIRLFETGDPRRSCQFANVAASLSVEGLGIEKIPVREQIEAVLSKSS